MEKKFPIIGKLFLAALAALLLATTSRAEGIWPIGISFSPEHHVPEGVIGLALGLPWGEYEAVVGIEASLAVNKANRWMVGIQVTPGVNEAKNPVLAWQAAGIANYAEDSLGIQTAIAYNRVNDSLHGMQFGAANFAGELWHGLQIGIFNRAGPPGAFDRVQNGIQFGVVNWSDNISGTQLGLWNRAPDIHGLQLGLLNIVSESSLPCLPLLLLPLLPPPSLHMGPARGRSADRPPSLSSRTCRCIDGGARHRPQGPRAQGSPSPSRGHRIDQGQARFLDGLIRLCKQKRNTRFLKCPKWWALLGSNQ